MSDLIYRQKAIEALDKDIMGGLNYKSILNRLPSEEVSADIIHLQKEQAYMQGYEDGRKTRKGKWIYKDDLKEYFCSECGYPSLTYDDVYIYSMDLPNFCEDCGTDMRKGGEK